ncbi:MAG: amidohydrolase family protein [Alphaproteobacteria bacterium]
MTRAVKSLAHGLIAAWLMGPSAPAAELYTGLTLIDPIAESRTQNAYILVDAGKIAAIGAGAPPAAAEGAEWRDMGGLFAIPGLIDTHAHVTLGTVSGGRDEKGPYLKANTDPAVTAQSARMLLAYGITTIRNPGGETGENLAYERAARVPGFPGPEALSAGLVIDRTPVRFVGLTDIPTPERPVKAIVAEQAKAGVDYIKLYTELTEADLAEGIAAAHAHGIKAIAHLGRVSWTKAVDMGLDALVHMMPISPELIAPEKRAAFLAKARPGGWSFFEWYEAVDIDGPEIGALVKRLAARKVHVDGTLIAFKLAFWGDDPAFLDAVSATAHPSLIRNWRTVMRFDQGWSKEDYARAKAIWPKALALTRKMYQAGVPLTIGTDTPNPFVGPGVSLAYEMALHQEAGIPTWAVLRMATSDAARILGVARKTGRLARGYEADIAFLAADPSVDAFNARTVEAVVSNGAFHRADELKRASP